MKLGRLNHVGVATPSIADAIPYWRDAARVLFAPDLLIIIT
jgi:hypothetical protein